MPSTSGSHQASCWDQTTSLTSTGREITSHRSSTSLPSPSNDEHLTTIPSRQQSTSRVRTQPADIYTTSSRAIHRQRPCDTSWTNIPVHLRQGQPSWHHVVSRLRPDGHQTPSISLCARDTIWSKAHRHIQMYFPHMMNITKWQEEATSTSKTVGNIMHSKGATITIKYNDDVVEID